MSEPAKKFDRQPESYQPRKPEIVSMAQQAREKNALASGIIANPFVSGEPPRTKKEILTCINEGAMALFSMLGDGPHMERIDYDYYSVISPKPGEQGTRSVFNIRLEHLPDEEARDKINEINSLNMHMWWNVDSSDRIYRIVTGHDRRPDNRENSNAGEYNMALLPSEKRQADAPSRNITIKKVNDPQSFALWANIVNGINGDGGILHPEHHYHHCESGTMDCWLGFYKEKPAAVISALYKDGIAALFFLGTLKRYRKKGLARALASAAIDEAFRSGAKIAIGIVWSAAKPLADSLGFKVY